MVLNEIAVLTRSNPDDAFEMPGEVALIGKPRGVCNGSDGLALVKHSAGAADANLIQICMGRKAKFILEHPDQMERAEVGFGGELLE